MTDADIEGELREWGYKHEWAYNVRLGRIGALAQMTYGKWRLYVLDGRHLGILAGY